MKILHNIPNFKKGSAKRLVLNSSNALQSISNIEVQLFTFRAENDYQFLTEWSRCCQHRKHD